MSPMPLGWRKAEDAKRMEKFEVAALLHAAREIERDPRAYYMLALMYLLALRLGEAVLLRWEHIGPLDEHGLPTVVRVPTLKKRKEEPPLLSVPVLSHPRLVLAAFNRARQTKRDRKAHSPWLFAGNTPAVHLSNKQGHRLFGLCRDAARLDRRYTPHALRHTACVQLGIWEVTRLGRLDPSENTAKAFLRHSDRSATRTYMRLTNATWGRYRGALDLPELKPLSTAEGSPG